MTAKNVPAGAPDMMSTITKNPNNYALIKPAREQYSINNFRCSFWLSIIFCIHESSIKTGA